MRHLVIFIFLFGFLSCSKNSDKVKILPKKDFVSILIDIHTYDAFATDYSLNLYMSGLDSADVYSSIMEKHHTNGESFKATMAWYTNRPEKLSEVYDEVFGELNKREQDINSQIQLFTNTGSTALFNAKNYKQIIGDTAKLPDPFLIETKGKGTYLVTVQMRMLQDDQSINPKVLAYFCKNRADENSDDRILITESIISKSNFTREFQVSAELNDTLYKFIKIIVPKTENPTPVYKKNFQISSIRVARIPPPIKLEEKDVK
jgi:hypothetical protein